MTRPRGPIVYVFASREALAGLRPAAAAAGLRLRRVEAIRAVACRTRIVSGRALGLSDFDTLVVTSRRAADRRLRRWLPRGERTWTAWAAGPGTAAALRRLGLSTVRQGLVLGGPGIARAIGPARRTILYVRSAEAGPTLARALRLRGHRVQERVTYALRTDRPRLRRQTARLAEGAAAIFTSPSTLSATRAAVGPARLRLLARRLPAFVLGNRTGAAARRAGFRRVVAVGSTDPQRLVRQLVRALGDDLP